MKFLTYQIPSTFLFIVYSTCLCFLLIFISQKINYGALCTFSLAHINIYTICTYNTSQHLFCTRIDDTYIFSFYLYHTKLLPNDLLFT